MTTRLALLLVACSACVSTIGAPCALGEDCAGGQFCAANFPSGYCMQDCTSSSCPIGSACISFNGGASAGCYQTCKADTDCRTGYYCFAVDQSEVCYPK